MVFLVLGFNFFNLEPLASALEIPSTFSSPSEVITSPLVEIVAANVSLWRVNFQLV